jgi:hypothetical protein
MNCGKVMIGIVGVMFSIVVGCAPTNEPLRYHLEARTFTLHTQPEGARVYQLVPPSGQQVDLGMTPLIDQPVMVVTEVNGSFGPPENAARLTSQLSMVRVRVEKDGFTTYETNIATREKESAERTIVLEPVRRVATTTTSAVRD